MSQSPSLRVELKSSFLLGGVLGSVHLLALTAAAISLHGWPLFLLGAGILLSGVAVTAEALFCAAAAARGLELRADGQCAWRDGGDRWHESRIVEPRFVAGGLIVLGLRTNAQKRKWIVLLPDSSDRESLRRLRVWLRWSAQAHAASRDKGAVKAIPDQVD